MGDRTERAGSATRGRIVDATAALLRRRGYDGTGVKQIAREADATLGSVYHFFPEGKEQLAVAALRRDSEHYTELLRVALSSSDDPAEAVAACALLLADRLRESDWRDGCLVAAAALENVGRSPTIQAAWKESLATWQEQIAARLRACDVPAEVADDTACTVLSTLEGAEILSRITADDKPLRTAAGYLGPLVTTVCPAR
ncbi:TetR/AcrR family transcriptional repressor of lmrAB and yxaGH operons [Lipingzhangella halophila]|uniref:TetR/AcrR family transcriptional repressor of lmrAB and yxaGH operons n=1 Tax=Lipingzhangella halophila TaxID=1783352 RepID=A0A7W7RCN2_9ACTN|nr:TetR/AcrR family transcriptional regulator [Lipingzhangella halophila]MBB4929556.1 TetR/AcrR family transcriptional repressor of lmrAB and yxaGH operons [Lipingzhangella halophila]